MKPIEIEWFDSKQGSDSWEYIDEIQPEPPALCKTLGYILKETEDYITVIQTHSKTQALGRITIPKCSIKKYNFFDK